VGRRVFGKGYGYSEVTKQHGAIIVDQQIRGFNVSVNKAIDVKVP